MVGMMIVVTTMYVTLRPATLLTEDASLATQLNWPPEVTACYGELLTSHKLNDCREKTRKKYNLTDTDPQNCSTSTNNSNNCIAVCFAFYDQMECIDHLACDYCSTNESIAFDEALKAKVNHEKKEGKCRHIDDYYVNRTRCSVDGPPPLTGLPTSGDSQLLSSLVVILICCMLGVVLLAVCWMMLKLYFTGSLFEESSTKLGEPQGKSARKEYGPADFMDPKSKRRRLKSFRSSQRVLKSQLKSGKVSQMQKDKRTPKKKGQLSLKTAFKTVKTSKIKHQSKASSTGGTGKKPGKTVDSDE